MIFSKLIEKQTMAFQKYLECHTPQHVPHSWIENETRFYKKYLSMRYDGLIAVVIGSIVMSTYLLIFKSESGQEQWWDFLAVFISLPALATGCMLLAVSFDFVESAPTIINRMGFHRKPA